MDTKFIYEISKFSIFQRGEETLAKLEEYFDIGRPAFHYFILSRNHVSVNPQFVRFDDEVIELEFVIQKKSETIKERVKWYHKYTGLMDVKVISDFPYSKFKVVDEFGSSLISDSKAAYVLELPEFYNQVINKDLLDYEILYVGESARSENNVPAYIRTTSHRPLQKILTDYSQKHRDKELFLLFFSHKQDVLIDFPENQSDAERVQFIETFRKLYLSRSPRNLKRKLQFLEALLINYFDPVYNGGKFKVNSPNENHKSFKDLFGLNLKSVSIVIGLENFCPRLFTNKNQRTDKYEIEFEFNN